MNKTKFIVSLDFELTLGLHDIDGYACGGYKENILGARKVIPKMLESFKKM